MERKELPEGWEWKKVGEIAEQIQYGYTQSADSNPIGPKFLRITDIQENTVNWEDVPYCKISESEKGKYLLKPGDVLFSRTGATVGKSYLVNINVPESIFASYLIRVVFNSNVDSAFINYYFQSTGYWNQVLLKKVGAGQPGINSKILAEIKVPLPPLPVQRRIVEILEQADTLRHLRAQADAETQKLLQSVFYEMFGDPVRNEKGWERRKLEDICINIFGGGTPSTLNEEYFQGNIPWVSPKDMKDDFILDSIDHISEKALNESSTQIAPKYSLLMVIRSGILKRKLPVAINVNPVAINQDMKAFVFKQTLVEPIYMLFFFKLYQNVLLQKVRSVTADNLEFNQIKRLKIPIPPLFYQQQFSQIANEVRKIKERNVESKIEIEKLFNTLMAEAFIGNLN